MENALEITKKVIWADFLKLPVRGGIVSLRHDSDETEHPSPQRGRTGQFFCQHRGKEISHQTGARMDLEKECPRLRRYDGRIERTPGEIGRNL